eukprot:scaffold151653_cov76-Cyclotella_meneghiniana.AAC.2
MRFSTLCLQVIGLSGAATTASVFRDLQVFLATSQALLSISSKGAVSSSASCIPHGSDPLDGQTISRYINGNTWSVSGGGGGKIIYASQYLMGIFNRIEGNVAYYTQGDLCGSTPRSVVVTFNEDCSYEIMQITSSAEPGLCSYTIGITGVCYCSSVPSSQPSLSLQPSESSHPSTQPSGVPSSQPSLSLQPSESSHPSTQPSSSSQPSESSHPSTQPSSSSQPSFQPSLSTQPSLSSQPSESPSIPGQLDASFDSEFGAPRCSGAVAVTSCDTGSSLLVGRGTSSITRETNQPNTIDGCPDGVSSYDSMFVNRIIIRSENANDPFSSAPLELGKTATIIASIKAYATYDSVDFFFASDATNPQWQRIGTLRPTSGGFQDLVMSYTVPVDSITQAVRVQYRYSTSSTSACATGYYTDWDDLVFDTIVPTISPSLSSQPSESAQPSSQPSISTQPSSIPSSLPSFQPSSQPSLQPSTQPSSIPSSPPSQSARPSSMPSSKPSESARPSSMPSNQPSLQPSNQPSLQPSQSARPSSMPSSQPSESARPSSMPSTSSQPSLQPSNQPSLQPSESSRPSSMPSLQPSESDRPSSMPSSQPSLQPSNQPSIPPSQSARPSTRPSSMPSSQPSLQPSNQPSLQPSESSHPSSMPSSQPSKSDRPSSMPSSQPSLQPSNQPSLPPSDQPSTPSQPSNTPSLSILPTSNPSETPSSMPSMKPSIVIETVTTAGSLSINQDVCSFSAAQLAGFVEAITKTIRSFVCSDPTNEDCSAEVTSACGSGREL